MTRHPEAAVRAWCAWRVEAEMGKIGREYGLIEPLVDMATQMLSAEELLGLLVANARPMFDLEALRESLEKSKRLMDG